MMILKYFSDFNVSSAIQSTLFKNYFFLSVYQIINFAVPLIIIPFIIAKVGVANFGLIAFSYAFANYFNVLVDYGFNLSATKKISINRDHKEIINTTFTTVLSSKLIFLLISFFLYSILVFAFPVLHQQWLLHICSFTIVIGQALIPVWLFQGMEDMKYLAACNIIAKLAYLISILIFIRLPQDYYLINLLQGVTTFGAGLLSIYICFKKFNVRFISITIKNIAFEINDGKLVFFSSLAVNIYVNSNAFILGLFAPPSQVGIYSIAEKVYFALKQLDNVFSQVIFPQVCVLAQQQVSALQAFLKKIFIPFVVLTFIACTFVFFTSRFISAYFLKGLINYHLLVLIHIFCFTVIVNAFSTPTFQTLLAYNEKKKVGVVLLFGCILNIVLNLVLVNLFQSAGSAFAVLITESFITIGFGYYFLMVLKQKKHEITHLV